MSEMSEEDERILSYLRDSVSGGERYFRGKLDGELENLERAIRADLGLELGR